MSGLRESGAGGSCLMGRSYPSCDSFLVPMLLWAASGGQRGEQVDQEQEGGSDQRPRVRRVLAVVQDLAGAGPLHWSKQWCLLARAISRLHDPFTNGLDSL